MAMFREVFADEDLPEDLEHLAALGAWLAHLAVMLYFVHDRSRGQRRTRRLADAVARGFDVVVPLATMPPFNLMFANLADLARELAPDSP